MNVGRLISLLCLFVCLVQGASSSEFRTFTDTRGRQMEAKVTRVSGEDVFIERKDGFDTRVDISVFSEEDQEYIKKWAYNKLLESDVFDVRFSSKRSDRNEYSRRGIIYDEYNMHYGVVITNNDYDHDFKDIRVEYLILKFEDQLAAEKRSEGTIHRIKGVAHQNLIKAREEVRVNTEKFPMLETQLAQGFVWKGGGRRDSKDVARGIWVKIYVGDKLVHEVSKPINMMRKESWN